MIEDLIVLGVGALFALGGVGAMVAAQIKKNRAVIALDPVWEAWAARRGFAFEASRPFGVELTAPRVNGVVGGVHLTVDGMELDPQQLFAPSATARERRRMPHTAVAARAIGASTGSMIVLSRARIEHNQPVAGYRQMDLSDARFDDACQVWASPGSPAHHLDDRRVRAALTTLAQRPFVLCAQAGILWIRWPGYEHDPAMLDHAVTALVAFAKRRA